MQHSLRHCQGPFTHLDAEQQLALRIDGGPDSVGRPREPLNRLSFAQIAASHRTEDNVEFVELDLLEMHLVQKIGRKGVQLLGGFHQPAQDGIGVDLEDPRRPSDASTFGQTRDDVYNALG
jgi:hypothetical protein